MKNRPNKCPPTQPTSRATPSARKSSDFPSHISSHSSRTSRAGNGDARAVASTTTTSPTGRWARRRSCCPPSLSPADPAPGRDRGIPARVRPRGLRRLRAARVAGRQRGRRAARLRGAAGRAAPGGEVLYLPEARGGLPHRPRARHGDRRRARHRPAVAHLLRRLLPQLAQGSDSLRSVVVSRCVLLRRALICG